MFRSPLLVLLFPIFQIPYILSESEPKAVLPEVDGSYIAVGEVVMRDASGDGDILQVKFDETFDSDSGNAAFTIHEKGGNITFIEDALINQTFAYINGVCTEFTVEEWDNIADPASLIGYETDDGRVRFSLKQLFDIPNEFLVPEEDGKAENYRGIPAQSWLFRIESKEKDGKTSVTDIYSYWSNESWSSTSSFGQIVPLGFTIIIMVHDEADKKIQHTEQNINIYSFIHDAVDRKQFEPRQGIHCPGKKSVFTFPELSKAKTISFKSEVVFPDQNEVKTMDVWYDMKNGYHRMDLDRIFNQNPDGKYSYYTSVITSKSLDTSYFINIANAALTCEVKPTSQYDWDYQQIINPKLDLKSWNMETLFALDSTDYTYIGKTSKRNIPCHLFQGIREDWPTADVGIKSLWEWCVVALLGNEIEKVNFKDGNIGLVSAQITFSQKDLKDELKITDKDTATIIHHFYNVKEEDPLNMDFSTFDISLCFTLDQKRRIEFAVDIKVNKDNFEQVENATSDPAFLNAWKTAISEKSKLALNTLRLTKVKSMVWGGNLLVSFTVLDVHPSLADDAKHNKPSLEEAINNLNDSIKAGQLQIKFAWAKDKEPETLMASKDSLKDIIIKPSEVPTIPPPVPTESTTSGIIFSLKTPSELPTDDGETTTEVPDGGSTSTKIPDGGSTSTKIPDGGSTSTKTSGGGSTSTKIPDGTSTEPPLIKKVFKGHSSGTVAGVSIAMLVVGISLGAGGTFFKLRIAPRH